MERIRKLKHAPLKEVILEIRWEGEVDDFGVKFDQGFELAQGRFSEKVAASFPVHKKLLNNTQTPEFGIPIHQYWTAENQWPVLQHGPGVITINQTEEGYMWGDFEKSISAAVSSLRESYKDDLKFTGLGLSYFDAFDLDADGDALNFIKDNLQTSLNQQYNLPGRLEGIQINRSWKQADGSVLNVNMTDAVNNLSNSTAIVMVTTAVHKNWDKSLELTQVINNLHTLCSDSFKQILNKKYYGSLNQ